MASYMAIRFMAGAPGKGKQVRTSLSAIGGKKFSEVERLGFNFEDPNVFFAIGPSGEVKTISKPSPKDIAAGLYKQIEPHDFLFDTGDKVKVVRGENKLHGEILTVKNRAFLRHGQPGYTFSEGKANSPMAETSLELVERAIPKEEPNLFDVEPSRTIVPPASGYYDKVAKSAAAMVLIARKMSLYGGEVTDEEWRDTGLIKFGITRKPSGEFGPTDNTTEYSFLAFRSKDQRALFILDEENRQLIKDYLMIDNNITDNNDER